MLYYLHTFSDFFGPLRLFEYISFRAGGAFFTVDNRHSFCPDRPCHFEDTIVKKGGKISFAKVEK